VLAPVGISAYIRTEHLRRTVEALQANTLARQTEVFIFSDGPRPGDERRVAEVRDFSRRIRGFREVHVLERLENSRVRNNRDGIRKLLNEYGQLVWLEEDIVTAPGFLKFMNDALSFYREDERIISICGYSPPISIPARYTEQVFALGRFCAWGFATWREKFDPYSMTSQEIRLSPRIRRRLVAQGRDSLRMAQEVASKELDALDVNVMYHQASTGTQTIYPIHSLVQNIGHDGSGCHSGVTARFQHGQLWNKTNGFRFVPNIAIDRRIEKANRHFRNGGYRGELRHVAKEIRVRLARFCRQR